MLLYIFIPHNNQVLGSSNKILALQFCCFSLTSPSALWSVKWRWRGRNIHFAWCKVLPFRYEVPGQGETLQARLRKVGSTRTRPALEVTELSQGARCSYRHRGSLPHPPGAAAFELGVHITLLWQKEAQRKMGEGLLPTWQCCGHLWRRPGSQPLFQSVLGLSWSRVLKDGWCICR